MEVLYKKLYGFRKTVIEYWVIYLISVVMNYLGEREVISGEQTFWQKMTDLNNSAVFILLLLTVVMLAYYLLLMVTGYYARKQEPVTAFTRIMKEHSIEQAHAKIAGGLVWGQDRTLWTAPNIVLGVERLAYLSSSMNGHLTRNRCGCFRWTLRWISITSR